MKHILPAFLLLAFCSSVGAQSTYYVPDDYATIQGGIDGIGGGAILIVRDGTYTENINFNGKAITLKSENGSATTIIDGSQSGTVIEFSSGEGANSVIDGFTVQNGSAGVGGGIHCGSSTAASSPTIRNCVITGNTATNGGGGIYCINGSSPSLDGCTFTNNSTAVGQGLGTSGGGIACYDNSNPTITNCTFQSGYANDGGGIYCNDSSPTIMNCVITNNTAKYNGGGVYCTGLSSPIVEDCIFSNNKTEIASGGGWHCVATGSPIVSNCIFLGNESAWNGGGVFCSSASLVLNNCLFDSNTSLNDGGGVHCSNSSAEIVGSVFVANSSVAYGGGFYVNNAADKNLSIVIQDNEFRDNVAHHGGGIQLNDSDAAVIQNNLFYQNHAITISDGGGIHVGMGVNPVSIFENTFSENTADHNGGAILVDYGSVADISNCIVWGNITAMGGPIHEIGGSTANVTYSDIEGGFTGTGNLDADPLFVDTLNRDFRLQHVFTGHVADSPCIDTGDPSITPYGSTRTDGIRDSGIIDIGFRPLDTDIDSDGDGLEDNAEAAIGSDPMDQDTDDDGLSDGEEVYSFFTDPLSLDTDNDGIQDGTEVGNDTWWLGEPWNGIGGTDTSINIPDADTSTTTDPLDDDTDNDGLMDGQEDANHDGQFLGIELDPNDFDCDNDGLGDGLELGLAVPNGNDTDMTVFVADVDPSTTTRATHRDTDGGGIHDGIEDANRNGMIDAGEIDPRDASDDSVYMKISPMVEGGSVTFNYYGCEPYSWMHLCYSLAGPGPTSFTNITLDLSPPIGSRPPLQINSNGTAQLGPVPIPSNIIVGDQLWFQGVQYSLFGASNVLTTTNMIPVTVQ